jgi:hypothetical protein
MNPLLIPILALTIPIIAILGRLARRWMDIKERQMLAQSESAAALTAEKTAQYAVQTEKLEHRVRVLERIVTDRGAMLADEIDALRDLPTPPRADTPRADAPRTEAPRTEAIAYSPTLESPSLSAAPLSTQEKSE